VLATIAFDGWKLAGPGLTVANAQLAVSGDKGKYPEFAGNVNTVEARDFWRDVEVSPQNQGYHYNRNAETYMEVGNALGWAMADLLNNK
jgi:alpha-galactosidase